MVDAPKSKSVSAVRGEDRIASLDEIRGYAVLGILIMNITAMGLPASAGLNPSVYGADDAWNLQIWYAQEVVFAGAMRALFSMLFGAGLLLFLDRLEARGVGALTVKLISKRALLLIAFGVFDTAVLLWDGDILWTYGIAVFCLLPFWKASNKALTIVFIAVFAWQLVWVGTIEDRYTMWHTEYVTALDAKTVGTELSPEQVESIDRWDNIHFWYSSEDDINESLQKPTKGWWILSKESVQSITSFSIGRFLRLSLLDSLLGMSLGMLAYRSGLLSGHWPLRRVAALSFACLAVAVPLRLGMANTIVASDYSVLGFLATLKFYDIGRLLMACFWIGTILMLASLPYTKWIRKALAATGRLALTNYLLQSAMAAVFFVGFGYFGAFSRAELMIIVVVGWAVCISFSLFWLRWFWTGPAEWLWRKGIYRT